MLTGLRWLGLEVKDLARARRFYGEHLGMTPRQESDDARNRALGVQSGSNGTAVRLAAGEHDLVVRRPKDVPRGGVHTHYAMAVSPAEYEERFEALSESFDLEERRFGDARSLYLYDPDGHCVELGERGSGTGIEGIFEIVLEVEDLERALAFYRDLGFDVSHRGTDRPRVRLDGPVELELWEPQLGIADARGGLHVDVGFSAADPEAAVEPVADRIDERVDLDDGLRVRDPDCHWLTVLREE